jgi:uncharacterized protein
MKFTREQSEGLYTVHAYQHSEVILNSPNAEDGRDEDGRIALTSSFIISPGTLLREWAPRAIEQLEGAHLFSLGELELEVVLLGTGNQMRFPNREQLQALIELGIGYEVMDSAAACRTYNILAGEGRQVAAAIILE